MLGNLIDKYIELKGDIITHLMCCNNCKHIEGHDGCTFSVMIRKCNLCDRWERDEIIYDQRREEK